MENIINPYQLFNSSFSNYENTSFIYQFTKNLQELVTDYQHIYDDSTIETYPAHLIYITTLNTISKVIVQFKDIIIEDLTICKYVFSLQFINKTEHTFKPKHSSDFLYVAIHK